MTKPWREIRVPDILTACWRNTLMTIEPLTSASLQMQQLFCQWCDGPVYSKHDAALFHHVLSHHSIWQVLELTDRTRPTRWHPSSNADLAWNWDHTQIATCRCSPSCWCRYVGLILARHKMRQHTWWPRCGRRTSTRNVWGLSPFLVDTNLRAIILT